MCKEIFFNILFNYLKMINISEYKILPQLSQLVEPIVVSLKLQSDIAGEIEVSTKIVIDVVYKKLEQPITCAKYNIVKGENDIDIKVTLK
jgi:hypothetical protein